MLSLWNGFDDLMRFDDVFRGFATNSTKDNPQFLPAVDIKEDDGAYHITAELPGMKVQDVSVEVDGNVLTISGERKFEKKSEKEGWHRVERRYGSFSRRFFLPDTVDGSKIDAKMQDGLLFVALPKAEVTKARKIQVRATD
ncbi:MAG: Hsp20/alpha crystallin family protein [Polyangiaceae bacterium]